MSSIGLEFQPFLYAQIGDDANGVPLSVLSALARQNIDPWEQAARWSRLTQNSAIQELAALIAKLPLGPSALPLGPSALPPGSSAQAMPDEIATQLIVLLPNHHGLAGRAPASASAAASELVAYPVITKRMQVVILCVLTGLLAQWLFAEFDNSAKTEDAQTMHASHAPTPSSQP